MFNVVTPCAANGFKPPVKSFVIRDANKQRGTRLVVYSSLKQWLAKQAEKDGVKLT